MIYVWKVFVWFVMLAIIAALLSVFSCQSQRQWREKGIKNGWIEASKVTKDTVFSIKVDTVKLAVRLDTATAQISYLLDSAGCDTAIIHDTVFIHKIKRIIEKQIVKHYIVTPGLKFSQDTVRIHDKNGNLIKVWFKGDKMNLELISTKNTVLPDEIKWYEKYWWLPWVLLLVLILAFWLAKR